MIARLETHGFRNLADGGEFSPGPGQHLLTGANGAGKTSLLEAIYLAATTRSFRTPRLADCVRHGEDGFLVRAEAGPGGRTRLEVSFRDGARAHSCNGAKASPSQHLAHQPVVAWTAAAGRILDGPPELRRRMLDRGILAAHPVALAAMGRFRRALRHKRQLLAAGGRREIPAWNQVVAAAAAEIATLRCAHVELLEGELRTALAMTGLDLPPPELTYRPSPRQALEGEDALREALDQLAARELERGSPLAGPHRDDLIISWRGQEVARRASAGEGKALGLLLAAAQARVVEATGREPLLLLDDADTELDGGRLRALWPAFAAFPQVLASSNRPEVWEGASLSSAWHLRDGTAVSGMAR